MNKLSNKITSYTIVLFNKSEIRITAAEFASLKNKSGLVYIPSQDRIVNTHTIAEVVNSEVLKVERNEEVKVPLYYLEYKNEVDKQIS